MSLVFRSRGVGLDRTPGCFVCGGDEGLHNNIAAFTDSRADGEAVVELFDKGARLDYREHEPNWIQVKVGTCHLHLPALDALHQMTREHEGTISAEIIEAARQAPEQEHLVIKPEEHEKIKDLLSAAYRAAGGSGHRVLFRSKSREAALEHAAAIHNLWDAVRWATDIYKLKDQGDWYDWYLDADRMIVLRIKG